VAELVLHLGLPKTGTTALQHSWFPMAAEHGLITYLGKWSDGRGRGRSAVVDAFRASLRDRASGASRPEAEGLLEAAVAQLGDGIAVVSDEIMSAWPLLPDTDGSPVEYSQRNTTIFPTRDGAQSMHRPRRGCPPIVEYLARLNRALPDTVNLRVILTLRNQSDFFGSLYAQTAGWCKNPGPDDLRSKVMTLIGSDDDFLSWDLWVAELQSLLGPRNVLVAFYEDGLASIAAQIEDFLGIDMPQGVSNIQQANARRISPNSWAMRPRLSGLRLSSRLSESARSLRIRPPRLIGKFVSRSLAKVDHLTEKLLSRLGFLRPVEMPRALREEVAAWSAPRNDRLQRLVDRPLPEQYATGPLR
jgi:hypothetical protein